MDDREKIIDKIAKLKAHAESAEKIGSEAEAQAFAEMMQRLLLKHKLSLTDIQFAKLEQDEPVQEFAFSWQGLTYNGPLDNRNHRVAWTETLANIVARAHFCRILVFEKSARITIVGRKSDVAVAEFMIITLARAASKISFTEARRYKKAAGFSSRGFRESFLASFVQRIAERFEEERQRQEGAGQYALIRFNSADQAVRDFMTNTLHTKKAGMVKYKRTDHTAGWERGQQVANEVNLRSNAVDGGQANKQLS